MKEVDRAEGRRLLRDVEAGQMLADWGHEITALRKLERFLVKHAEALLADTWRPIEELPEEFKDGRPVLVWRQAEEGYASRRLGVDVWRRGGWYRSRRDMQPTHFRVIEPPGEKA